MNPQYEAHERLCKSIGDMAKENDELNEKINSLIKAGNELRDCASRIGTVAAGEGSVIRRTQEAIQSWDKEDK